MMQRQWLRWAPLLSIAGLLACQDFKCPEGTTRFGGDASSKTYCQTPDRVRHGPYRQLDHATGSVQQVGQLRHGKRHGLWTTYHASGSLSRQGAYHEGEMVGVHNVWNASGTLVARTTVTADGYAQERWYDNGIKQSESSVSGEVVTRREWTRAGSLIPQPDPIPSPAGQVTPLSPELEAIIYGDQEQPTPVEELDRALQESGHTR
jgi:hypothetical protein